MTSYKQFKKICVCLLAAAAMTALCGSGLLYRPDNALSDRLYQKPQALDGNIAILEIDQRSLDELGPIQNWGRGLMADIIRRLCTDPENAPAVIGLDILYSGETEAAGDQALADACSLGVPVVAACAADFGSRLVTAEDGSFYMDPSSIVGFDGPYDALSSAAAAAGHINTMLDEDGVLRHAIWRLKLPDGSEVPSLAAQICRIYTEKMDLRGEDGGQSAGPETEPGPETAPHIDEHSLWYVPFRAAPGGYSDGYSVSGLLDGTLPPEIFADKIVLIGPYASGLQDHFITSIDRAQHMYGVEYQANQIDALLHGDRKAEALLFPQLLTVFFLSALCLYFFLDRRILISVAVWSAVCCFSLIFCVLLYQNGTVLRALYVPFSVTLLFIASVALNYTRAALDKRRVTNTFQRYVAPEIVRELLHDGSDSLETGGRLTEIAVLFVDIRGFTTMSERLAPAQMVHILNRCLTLTADCILENGGTLDKFIGDCTMAFWGAPLPQKDSIFKAVKTALDMQERSRRLNESLRAQCGFTVSFGIGIHCGPAVVGNIGSPFRMDYTAIGDTVNTASRLESNAPPGNILVSAAVADAVRDRVQLTSLGTNITLKGKTEGFEIFRVDGLSPEKTSREDHKV